MEPPDDELFAFHTREVGKLGAYLLGRRLPAFHVERAALLAQSDTPREVPRNRDISVGCCRRA